MSSFSLHKIKYCSSSSRFPIMLRVTYFNNYKRSLSVKVNWSCVCFLGNVQYCGVQTAAGNNHYTSYILFSDREDWASTQAFKAVFAQSKQSRLHYQPGKTPHGLSNKLCLLHIIWAYVIRFISNESSSFMLHVDHSWEKRIKSQRQDHKCFSLYWAHLY